VKVYAVVPNALVLITEGDQVPVMPLSEIEGNAVGVAFKQNGPIPLNVGVTKGLTVIAKLPFKAHCPAFTVNV
jgi:hypothetical protein